mmetsp:Transcript_15458/g.33486  ORF Transcript_15458/g.33486 Transcript_15458/m.33486 type:complete len:91 (-) Transcript_15458:695-967(-)
MFMHYVFQGKGINVPGFNTIMEYRIRMKKQETTLLTCRSTTTLGVSKSVSPARDLAYMLSTALSAVPCVVKSVAAHHDMKAMRVQKMAPT